MEPTIPPYPPAQNNIPTVRDSHSTSTAQPLEVRDIDASISYQPTRGTSGDAARATQPGFATLAHSGYDILEELGRGGMGVVYRARDLRLKRHVALKMILAGAHADADHQKRFRAEAEAVAKLKHPNIVQIHEIGEQNGLPYFSLEYCPGGSLASLLKEHPLPPLKAALLVEQLSLAMQHAHLNGIIHRDLKPGNILLAGSKEEQQGKTPNDPKSKPIGNADKKSSAHSSDLVPKITDFGLAKQLDSEHGQTASGAVMGTPSYMAPEQAEGRTHDIGPATDIYSLGAILYECVTGRPPFRAATALETMQQVMTQSPVPVRQLQPAVPRDLETICLKCLHKDPRRRYAMAQELAADLRRFLRHEPVLARPIGNAERFWRWCRKNPAIASISAFALLLLFGTLVSVTALYLRAEGLRQLAETNAERAGVQQRLAEDNERQAKRERERAEENATKATDQQQRAERESTRAIAEADRAMNVTRFMTGLFETSDPFGLGGFSFYIPKAMGEKLTAREILQRGSDKIMTDKQTPARTRAAILDTIGNVNRSIGNYADADKQLTAALTLCRTLTPPDPLEVAHTLFNKGWLAHERGQYENADLFYREALKLRLNHDPDNEAAIAAVQFNLGWLLVEMEEYGEAEELLLQAVKRRVACYGEDHRETAIARIGLATLYIDTGDLLKAMPLSTGAFKVFQGEGNEGLARAASLFQTAVFQSTVLGNHTAAEKTLLESLALFRQGAGKDHLYNCFFHAQLGLTYRALNRLEDAEKQWRSALEVAKKQVGYGHPKIVMAVSHLAELLLTRGKPEEAEAFYQELIKAQKDRFGEKHFFVADALSAYATFLYRANKFPEQSAALREAIAIYRSKKGTPRSNFPQALNNYAAILTNTGNQAEGEAMYREAVELERKLFRPDQDRIALYLINLTIARMNQRLFDSEVERVFAELEETIRKLNGNEKRLRQYGLLVARIRYLRFHGRHREVAADATTAGGIFPKSPRHLYEAAVELARCLPLLEKSKGEPPATKQALRAEYTDKSLNFLRQAINNGWKSPALLKSGSDWAALRLNLDFQKILTDLEKATALPKAPSPP